MAYAVALEQFKGPLDLLLELIEEEKLDISQLALAQVTESYLRHLDETPGIPPEDLADFLVVASKLLFIKSRLLLPFLAPPEEGEGDLESQLRIYKEYLDASKRIEKMLVEGRFLFVRDRLPQVDIGFAPPEDFTAEAMREMFAAVLAKLEPLVRVPKAVVERAVSIHEKIERIRQLLAKAEKVSFRAVLADAQTKTEIVVSFLALLELIKQRSVSVAQEARFSDIVITPA